MPRILMKPIEKGIGKRLRELRQNRGFSLDKVSKQLAPYVSIQLDGKSGETRISAIENSRANLTIELAIAYSKVFDVSLEYIFCLSDDMQPEDKTIETSLGLTGKAISKIRDVKNCSDEDNSSIRLQILNSLFESDYMMELLNHLNSFIIASRLLNECVILPLDDRRNDTEAAELIAKWQLDKRVLATIEKIADLLENDKNLMLNNK